MQERDELKGPFLMGLSSALGPQAESVTGPRIDVELGLHASLLESEVGLGESS
jgi:hypothetical protein